MFDIDLTKNAAFQMLLTELRALNRTNELILVALSKERVSEKYPHMTCHVLENSNGI